MPIVRCQNFVLLHWHQYRFQARDRQSSSGPWLLLDSSTPAHFSDSVDLLHWQARAYNHCVALERRRLLPPGSVCVSWGPLWSPRTISIACYSDFLEMAGSTKFLSLSPDGSWLQVPAEREMPKPIPDRCFLTLNLCTALLWACPLRVTSRRYSRLSSL
jgi:predicted DCC family thiol-disulfide oxidoreductase YuxK